MASAKAQRLEVVSKKEEPGSGADLMGEFVFLALPMPVYKALSNEAAKRQQTLAQFLATAVSTLIDSRK